MKVNTLQVYWTWDPNDLRNVLLSIDRLGQNIRLQAYHEVPRQMAYSFRNILLGNISSGKFAGGYRSYVDRYADWKADYGGHSGFWMLSGNLLASIKIFNLGYSRLAHVASSGGWVGGAPNKYWAVGIPNKEMDIGGKSWYWPPDQNKGKKKPIAMYARVLEYGLPTSKRGSGVHPARPAFRPTLTGFVRREGIQILEAAKPKINVAWGRRKGPFQASQFPWGSSAPVPPRTRGFGTKRIILSYGP